MHKIQSIEKLIFRRIIMKNYIATSVQDKIGFVVHKSIRSKGSCDNFPYILLMYVFLCVHVAQGIFR